MDDNLESRAVMGSEISFQSICNERKSPENFLRLKWQLLPSKSIPKIFETVAFYAFSWLLGVSYLYLKMPSEMYECSLRAHTYWPPIYDMNIYEWTVLVCFNLKYCCNRSGTERNAGRWNKVVEGVVLVRLAFIDMSLVPGDTRSILHRKTVKENLNPNLDIACVIVSRFWR